MTNFEIEQRLLDGEPLEMVRKRILDEERKELLIRLGERLDDHLDLRVFGVDGPYVERFK